MAYEDFKDKFASTELADAPNGEMGENAPIRVRLPKGREVIGIITQRCGGSRMFVSCMDGKTRNCRVPVRNRRGLWLREGDVIIIEPWEFDNEKGDVLFKYTPIAVSRLKSMGKLTTETEEF